MTTRGGLVVLAIIFLAIIAVAVMREARGAGERVRCDGNYCMVPQQVMIDLVQKADLAEDYAKMCGWGER